MCHLIYLFVKRSSHASLHPWHSHGQEETTYAHMDDIDKNVHSIIRTIATHMFVLRLCDQSLCKLYPLYTHAHTHKCLHSVNVSRCIIPFCQNCISNHSFSIEFTPNISVRFDPHLPKSNLNGIHKYKRIIKQ